MGLFRFKLLDIVPIAREAMLEGLRDPVLVLDSQDRVVDFNSAAVELLQATTPQPLGRPAGEVFPDWPSLVEKIDREDFDNREIVWGQGSWRRHYELSISPLADQKGRPLGRLVILRDITKQKLVEKELRQAKELHELIADNTADLIAMCDTEARFVYVSPSYQTQLGYAPEDLLGRPIVALVHPEDLPSVMHTIAEGYRSLPADPISSTLRMSHSDGRWLWFESVGRLVFDAEGTPEGAVFNTRNITDRRTAEQALKESENRLRLVADGLPVLIAYIDKNLCCQFVNKEHEHWFGMPVSKIIGRPLQEVLGDSYQDFLPHAKAVLTGRTAAFEGRAAKSGGGFRHYLARLIPHFNDQNNVPGFFSMIEDTTERTAAGDALREEREEVPRAGRKHGAGHLPGEYAGRTDLHQSGHDQNAGIPPGGGGGKALHRRDPPRRPAPDHGGI